MTKKFYYFLTIHFYLLNNLANAQQLHSVNWTITPKNGLAVESVTLKDNEKVGLPKTVPLFSFVANNKFYDSFSIQTFQEGEVTEFDFEAGILCRLKVDQNFQNGWKAVLTLKNVSEKKIQLENVVPFGQTEDKIYLTSSGPWSLARARLFRPGLIPVSIILPDNAWEMGYSAVGLSDGKSICAIARRTRWDRAERKRYWTILESGGFVEYTFYADLYAGEWQNGLRLMFRDRFLYDLESFDNTLFEREDLKWIRNKYIITLQFAWDHNFYDRLNQKFNLEQFFAEGQKLFGGYDVYGIWPTWPTLGLDPRNQFDLFRDLPGGLVRLKEISQEAKKHGTKFFVCYNPWDESTRRENHLKALSRLIAAVDADGVVLDTRGSSSKEFQDAADRVKPGVVMYSEGMALPKDMPGIVAGRVHDAIFKQPLLNLNKLIKPEFGIFRVLQLSQGRIHREIAISFFNGYGNELNTFAPGRPEWMEEEFLYMGKLTRILRENSSAFLNKNWTPFIPTRVDSIWVNKWQNESRTLYTIFSLKPEGYHGPLFEIDIKPQTHFVDLYHHEEVIPDTLAGKDYLPAKVDAFNQAWLGTRREGSVDCLAELSAQLRVELDSDSLFINASNGSRILLWAGNPAYSGKYKEFSVGNHRVKLLDLFGRFEGKFIVQLFDKEELLDERVIYLKPGIPRLMSKVPPTELATEAPPGMVEIPAGVLDFSATQSESFIPYPDFSTARKIQMPRFFMDKFPVTNKAYQDFVKKSGYVPADTTNYLKHWRNGTFLPGEGNFPVVYVSIDDARAYARWAGKRLPTQMEWQYAGQGSDGRSWPWGNEFDSTRCNYHSGKPTSVQAFANGASPFGVMDLVGNVWQMTGDVYENGSYYFVIIKGGSYFKPSSSWWYVQGGPQPLNKQQMLLMVSPGFERNATVGFRCVKDAR